MQTQSDPLTIHGARLTPESRTFIESEVKVEIQEAFQKALNDPFPKVLTEC